MATEDMDVESGQVARDTLSVSLILRKIFCHFSTTELLKLSLVNKLWSYEARSLLRDRGTVTFSVNKNWRCPDLVALASDLQRTKEITRVHPFSGLRINVGGLDCDHGDESYQQSLTPELYLACQDILDQLTWRHFTVRFYWEWTEELTNCPGFLLVKTILENFSSVLENFTFGLPYKQEDFMQQLIQGCCSSFSRLQTLRVESSNNPDDGYTDLIRLLVSHSPNLKVLHTSGRVNLSRNLLEGSSAVHVTDYPFSPFLNEIPDDAGPIRMTRMDLVYISEDLVVERFNRITMAVLEASRTTLSSMHIDALFLTPLTTYGISLENVRTLKIHLEHQKLAIMYPRSLRVIKNFGFTRTFPNLKAVDVICYSFDMVALAAIDEMVEQGNAALGEPLPDRAANIKNLRVQCSWQINDSTGKFLFEMFPNVESLSISGTEIPFGRIWESLHDLKTLDAADVNDQSVGKNLDSVFCGIFPEEVALLREQDEEYLKAVNIVPVTPSITCLKELRSFKMMFGDSDVSMDSVGDPTYLFSKVTALIAFQRCPHLAVSLITDETRRQLALSHLEPYARILSEDDDSCLEDDDSFFA